MATNFCCKISKFSLTHIPEKFEMGNKYTEEQKSVNLLVVFGYFLPSIKPYDAYFKTHLLNTTCLAYQTLNKSMRKRRSY